MNLVSDWWLPKANNQKGEIWITDSMISQNEVHRVDLIANLCLAEICIGNFEKFQLVLPDRNFLIVIFY